MRGHLQVGFPGFVNRFHFFIRGIALRDFGDGLEIGFGNGPLAKAVELRGNLGSFVPPRGDRFLEKDLLENQRANRLAQRRRIFHEGRAIRLAQIFQIRGDLRGFDLLIADPRDDVVGGARKRAGKNQQGEGREACDGK